MSDLLVCLKAAQYGLEKHFLIAVILTDIMIVMMMINVKVHVCITVSFSLKKLSE